MASPSLTSAERTPKKGEPARKLPLPGPAAQTHAPEQDPRGLAGNMAIQRAAAGPPPHQDHAHHGAVALDGGGCSCGGTCAECQKKKVQRRGSGRLAAVPAGFDGAVSRSGAGRPLGPDTRGAMEKQFSAKLDDVRIHDDGAAAEAAQHVQAHAFTTGRDVYFGRGRYEPGSAPGRQLLAHELTHVLQQRRGLVQGGMKSLNATPQNDVFEKEAHDAEHKLAEHPEAQLGAGSPSHQGPLRHHGSASETIQRKCTSCAGKSPPVAVKPDEESKTRPVAPVQRTAAPRNENTTSVPAAPKAAPAVTKAPRNVARAAERPAAAKPFAKGPVRPRNATARGPANNTARNITGSSSAQFGSETDATSAALAPTLSVPREPLAASDRAPIQRYSWDDFVSDVEGTIDSVGDAASDAYDAAANIASEVWDQAEAFASALGGVVSFSGGALHITVPPIDVCMGSHALQFSLPEIGADFPFLAGAVPVGPVQIYGLVAVHLGFTPEISIQVGPCQLDGFGITIDPFAPEFSAGGGVDVTVGVGLGGEARVGLHGEVGAIVEWPDPPLILKIPALALEGGLAGFVRGIALGHLTYSAGLAYSGGSFVAGEAENLDLGLALDYGLAGYGSLQVLGQNLCTLYWPLFESHADTVLSLGFDAGLSITSGGATGDFTPAAPTLGAMDFADLGNAIPRNMFKDDCPLCDFMRALGLMPSQMHGPWKHPGPYPGPIPHVYPIDPGIPSKAKCRAACGPDCDTCKNIGDKYVCEDLGGKHRIWKYPNFTLCPTHQGCYNHDACYDHYAATTWEKGKLGIILGPGHRLCDLECICDYSLPNCVNWIMGKGGDATMDFSDPPVMIGGCDGPCPKEKKGTGGKPTFEICMADVELFKRESFADSFRESTGRIHLHRFEIPVEYIGKINLDIFAQASMQAGFDASVGPGVMKGCIDFDYGRGAYHGFVEVIVPAEIGGFIIVTGSIGANANWFCLIDIAEVEGGLSATGRGRLKNDAKLRAEVSCKGGKVGLDASLKLDPCLHLGFDLDAFLKAKLFGFELFDETWNLKHAEWKRCWPIEFDLLSLKLGAGGAKGAGPPAAALAPGAGTHAAPAAPAAGPAPAPSAPAVSGAGGAVLKLGKHALSAVSVVSSLLAQATDTPLEPPMPDDPAKASGKSNPCGDVKPSDDCGSEAMPLTQVTFSPGPLGQGGRVKASPLTKCAGNTRGSEPDNKIYKPQFDCINAAGQKGSWVRAHLLHGRTSSSGDRNLHGPGDDIRNLIISDKSLNGTMSSGAERPALDRVYGNNEVLWYDSRVDSYVTGLDFFSQSITVDFGSFNTKTKTEGPRLGGGTFVLKRTPPNCPASLGGGGGTPAVIPGGTTSNDCASPLDFPTLDIEVDGKNRKVRTKDAKHTKMAQKDLQRILLVAGQSSACSTAGFTPCEEDFCKAVAASDKKKFGGQIDDLTRAQSRYVDLLENAWAGQKPPSSGEWTTQGDDSSDVGFDMDNKAATTKYTVHANVTSAGGVFTGTHLFPGG